MNNSADKQCTSIKEYVAKKVIDDMNEIESMRQFLKSSGINIYKCNNSMMNLQTCKIWCIPGSSGKQCEENVAHTNFRAYCDSCSIRYTTHHGKSLCHDCFNMKHKEYTCDVCKGSNFKLISENNSSPIVVSCKTCNNFA